MALIARLQHPYIVQFKEAWVEKVLSYPFLCFEFLIQVNENSSTILTFSMYSRTQEVSLIFFKVLFKYFL
jgi:hypothetical protein